MRLDRITAAAGAAVLALLLSCPAVEAARAIDETRPAEPNGTVSVEMIAGAIRIEGWDRNEVRVRGTVGDDIGEIELESRGRHTTLELEPRGGRMRGGGTDLTIKVPSRSDVEIETVSGWISVDGTSGRLSIETAAGTIRIGGAVEDAEISAISGTIEFVSGSVIRRAVVESVSSRITVEGSLAKNGKLNLETISGSVVVGIPKDTPARYEISTFSGKISSDFGPPPKRSGDFMRGSTLEFKVGAGTAEVRISAFSGRVELHGR